MSMPTRRRKAVAPKTPPPSSSVPAGRKPHTDPPASKAPFGAHAFARGAEISDDDAREAFEAWAMIEGCAGTQGRELSWYSLPPTSVEAWRAAAGAAQGARALTRKEVADWHRAHWDEAAETGEDGLTITVKRDTRIIDVSPRKYGLGDVEFVTDDGDTVVPTAWSKVVGVPRGTAGARILDGRTVQYEPVEHHSDEVSLITPRIAIAFDADERKNLMSAGRPIDHVDGFKVRDDGGMVTFDPVIDGDYLASILDPSE